MVFVPRLVSEREVGGAEDCVWSTGVMLANGIAGADVHPATRAEYEALRVAGGDGPAENPGDGSRLSQLQRGLRERYELVDVELGGGWTELIRVAPVGSYVALNGHTGALPARLKWPGAGSVPHTLLMVRDRDLSALVLDPMNVAGGEPERATNDELRAFYEALPGGAWLRSLQREDQTVERTFTFDATAVAGELVVEGAGHSYLRLADGTLHPIAAGVDKRAFGPVELVGGGPAGPSDPRTTGYVIGEEAAFMLAVDVAFDPDTASSADLADAEHRGRRAEWLRWSTALNIPAPPTDGQEV